MARLFSLQSKALVVAILSFTVPLSLAAQPLSVSTVHSDSKKRTVAPYDCH